MKPLHYTIHNIRHYMYTSDFRQSHYTPLLPLLPAGAELLCKLLAMLLAVCTECVKFAACPAVFHITWAICSVFEAAKWQLANAAQQIGNAVDVDVDVV